VLSICFPPRFLGSIHGRMCPFYGPNWLPAAQYPVSGYHMAVVAGIVFFVVRALLALIPVMADRAPIKKWAALAALIVTAFYLVLSGAEVAT
jgi:hypothetical protein